MKKTMHSPKAAFVKPCSWLRIVPLALAAFALSGGFANADDGKAKSDDAPQKNTVTAGKHDEAKATGKQAKDDVAASARKVDLSTPATKLNFYGSAEACVGMSTFKNACTNKTVRADESFYRMTVGTNVKLTEDVTLGLEVSSARGQVRFH